MEDARHSLDKATAGGAALSRASSTCLICRSRKVRCGRELPGCRNCSRLGIRCPGYRNHGTRKSWHQLRQSADDIYRAAGVEKRRVGSCQECRSTKNRCSMTRPSCERCLQKGVSCIYIGRRERDGGMAPAQHRHGLQSSDGDHEPVQKRGDHENPHWSHSSSPSDENASPLHPENNANTGSIASPNRPLLLTPRLAVGMPDPRYLFEDELPREPALRLRLINTYFEQVHPLRCLAFIHKPSFMAALHRNSVEEEYGEPTLYAMCALSARILFLESHTTRDVTSAAHAKLPGGAWSEKARRQVLPEAYMPTIQHITTMVLLCEYGLRTDQNALAFFLSGCLFRAIRVLGLDTPRNVTPGNGFSGAADMLGREVEHRLVWASYTIDTLTASGVDKNSAWGCDFPHVPLPCPDQQFLSRSIVPPDVFLTDFTEWNTDRPNDASQYPSEMVMTTDAVVQPHDHPQRQFLTMANAMRDMDLPALTSVLVQIRANVLRLIRTAPSSLSAPVWDETSDFMRIIRKLDIFHEHIPERFRLTELNFYMHQDQHIVGAVYSLFFLYHSAVFDLTRVTLAGFSFPLSTAFQEGPPEFRQQCQDRCRFHADQVSQLIRQAVNVVGPTSLDDSFCSAVALESAKIQIVYAATVVHDAALTDSTRLNVHANLRLLMLLHGGKGGDSNLYVRTLLPICRRFGLQDVAHAWGSQNRHIGTRSVCSINDNNGSRVDDVSAEITGSPAIHHLSGAAPFRQARTELQTRQPRASPVCVLSSVETTLQPQIHPASGGGIPSNSPQKDGGLSLPPPRPPQQPPVHGEQMPPEFSISPSFVGAVSSNTALGTVAPIHSAHPENSTQMPVINDNMGTIGAGDVDPGLMTSAIPPLASAPATDTSIAEYSKAATEMQCLLTWDISEPTGMPPWLSFDWAEDTAD